MKPPARKPTPMLSVDDVFAMGSWWLRCGRPLVAGRINPSWHNTHAARTNVYLYPIPVHAPDLPMASEYLTLARAIRLVMSGELRPLVEDDLSMWSEAEQDYYRRA